MDDHNESSRAVVLAFVNTHADGAGNPERFGAGDRLLEWLAEVNWLGSDPTPHGASDADAAEVRECRDALLTVLLAHAHDPAVTDADLEQAELRVQRAGRRYPVATEINEAGARLLPVDDTGLPGVLARVFAAAAELALAGQWPRVKACRNEPCHTAFTDRTRNTSAVYCSPQCASQASMRAYRARRRDARTTPEEKRMS